MATKTFDLSVILKMVDRFSNPLKQSMQKFNNTMDNMQKRSKQTIGQFGSNLKSIGTKATVGITAPLALASTMAIKSALSMEDAWTGVLKTMGEESPEVLGKIKTSIADMALRIPLATEELYGIAEAAGQLGIHAENVPKFTEVMANLAATTNLSTEQAAMSLAQFAKVTNMNQENFQKLGSSISLLGNKLATTESAIVDMTSRIAGSGALVGMTEAEIVGLAGALSQMGIRAELGGTAISQVLQKIHQEIGTGSEKLQAFAKTSGMTVEEFEKAWKDKPTDAIIAFAQGLSKLEEEGFNTISVLDEFGFEGLRVREVLLKMKSASEEVDRAIELSIKGWVDGNYTLEEAALRYSTASSKMTLAKNAIAQMAAAFGEVLLPAILAVLDWMKPLIQWLKELSPTTKKIIGGIALVIGVLGPLAILISGIIIAVGAIGTTAAAVIGGVIAAAAVITGVVIGIMSHLDDIKQWFLDIPTHIKNLIERMKEFFANLRDHIEEAAKNFAASLVPDWLKNLDKKISGAGKWIEDKFNGGNEAKTTGQMLSSHSKADVTVRVQADRGSSAQVDRVSKDKDVGLKVLNNSLLGAGLAGGG